MRMPFRRRSRSAALVVRRCRCWAKRAQIRARRAALSLASAALALCRAAVSLAALAIATPPSPLLDRTRPDPPRRSPVHHLPMAPTPSRPPLSVRPPAAPSLRPFQHRPAVVLPQPHPPPAGRPVVTRRSLPSSSVYRLESTTASSSFPNTEPSPDPDTTGGCHASLTSTPAGHPVDDLAAVFAARRPSPK